MTRDTMIMFRAPEEVKAALKLAAKDDARTMSSLALKLVSDWLRESGYLKRTALRPRVRR